MKVIILCAGLGSRTGLGYPKSLFKFNDQECLIEKNIKTIKKMGVKNKDIIFATGFKHNMIKNYTYNKFSYIKNSSYLSTNMFYTLHNTLNKIQNQDVIVIYADIIFDINCLKSIFKSKFKITTLVDKEWLNKWRLKKNFKEDLEELVIKKNKIIKIGKKTKRINKIDGRYVGITKFNKDMMQLLKNKTFLKKVVKNYRKIDFTNLFMRLIDSNIDINIVYKKLNWFEFDEKEDFTIYESNF